MASKKAEAWKKNEDTVESLDKSILSAHYEDLAEVTQRMRACGVEVTIVAGSSPAKLARPLDDFNEARARTAVFADEAAYEGLKTKAPAVFSDWEICRQGARIYPLFVVFTRPLNSTPNSIPPALQS